MTGFGEASGHVDGIHFAVELRSLNNRYFKAVIRLPEELAALEPELESVLRQRLARGSVTLSVRYRVEDARAAHQINDNILLSYLDHLETIHRKVQSTDHVANIDLTALLALPGVLAPAMEDEGLIERARQTLIDLVNRASEHLLAMRVTEGRSTAAELHRERDAIRQRLGIIAERSPLVIEEYHTRLRQRMDDLIRRAQINVNEVDLVREIAVFAERADIAEEINRLRAHLVQMDDIISADQGDPAGRTLDFLAQEMLREANTIASKSNDAAISRAIVEIKGSIDRIKEQVQNIE